MKSPEGRVQSLSCVQRTDAKILHFIYHTK